MSKVSQIAKPPGIRYKKIINWSKIYVANSRVGWWVVDWGHFRKDCIFCDWIFLSPENGFMVCWTPMIVFWIANIVSNTVIICTSLLAVFLVSSRQNCFSLVQFWSNGDSGSRRVLSGIPPLFLSCLVLGQTVLKVSGVSTEAGASNPSSKFEILEILWF